MKLVSKLNASDVVWEHFKLNDCGEPLHLDEPVCCICCKTVATKSGNTTNMHLHLKQSLSSRQSTITGAFSQNTNRTVQNGAHSQTVQFATSLKRCSLLIPSKSRHFDKCCKHLTASTNCLGEHTCHKRQVHNCTA